MDETNNTYEETSSVQELDTTEGYNLLDQQSQKTLGISAADFLREYDADRFEGSYNQSDILQLEMLIPFAR